MNANECEGQRAIRPGEGRGLARAAFAAHESYDALTRYQTPAFAGVALFRR